MNKRGMLFISHAEKDEQVVRLFVDLLHDIGVPEDTMLCSSISEVGIPIKVDIYDYLRDVINKDNIIPIFMLSENYYKSAACLNEMGAVWVGQKDYYIFLIPPFNFSDIKGAINPNKKGIRLDYSNQMELYNLRDGLNQFKSQMEYIFNLKTLKNWERRRDEFIKNIHSGYVNKGNRIIPLDKCEGFCIGNYDNAACKVIYDVTRDEIRIDIDFSLIETDLSSAVIYIDHLNLERAYDSKGISFEVNSTGSIKIVEFECLISDRNVRKTIMLDNGWNSYRVLISEIGGFKSDWKDLCEIKFLFRKKDIDKGTLRIRNIKIN